MRVLFLFFISQLLVILTTSAQPDTTRRTASPTLLDFGIQGHTGFILAHSAAIASLANSRPVGGELTLSRMRLTQKAYEACNCVARVGAYASFVDFGNPPVLGQQFGTGVFFEPLLAYGRRVQLSVRATVGVSYLTRVFDAHTNPDNLFFSMPLSFWLGLGLQTRTRLTNRWHLTLAANYNHISNGGTRQPNKGMNFPTLSVGLGYALKSGIIPRRNQWVRQPLTQRWTARALLVGTVRVLPQTDAFPEQTETVWGLMATGGYRLNRFHALTGGLEFTQDGFVRGQIRRDGRQTNAAQLAVLAGYELWQGRYSFTIHGGWNLLEPGDPYTEPFFQRYQLLYRISNRITAGVGLKAHAQVAQGFDARLGIGF